MSTVAPAAKTEEKKKTPDVIHQVGPNGQHRLIVKGVKGEVVEKEQLAKCGDHAATCLLHNEALPQVFKIEAVEEFVTQTTQLWD